jgi:succinyl-CoA synthetase beta subunit
MNIHEYQAKQILDQHGVRVPRGGVASTPEEAIRVAQGLTGPRWVLKAQIHAGGRREGHFESDPTTKGGVRVLDSVEAVGLNARQMLNHVLVTKQTGPGGTEVKQVYVEEAYDIQRELYLGMLVDRSTSRVTFIASSAGGVNIERAARRSPESILRLAIDPVDGFKPEDAQRLLSDLGLDGDVADQTVNMMATLYDLFTSLDASLIEINPLAITRDGGVVALDAVLNFDDNALFRHPDVQALRDDSEINLGELQAAQHGFNYVKLDGNIGTLACGAGFALATVDAIRHYGGDPANFLDVPPDSKVDRVRDAFKLLTSDPTVESILVNVFGGGIMRCDAIADAILVATRETPLEVPLVVRLSGTNARLALASLRDSGPPLTIAENLADAAEKVVLAARETRRSNRQGWWDRVQGALGKRKDGSQRSA